MVGRNDRSKRRYSYDFTDEKGSYGMGEMSYLSKKGIIT
jgi:hypothetical protein